jgi:NAD(P)-dependent dehydrogenase (short-subunit alcohol dehydrogenase family)
MKSKPAVFITGGSGGLGLTTAKQLLNNGWLVFIGDNNEEMLQQAVVDNPGLKPVKIDVTSTDSVQTAFEQISSEIESLAGVVNFAGILRVGSMAELPEQTMQMVLDVNLMGTFRVNQVFLPLIDKIGAFGRKGRIINISSETGWQAGHPFGGAYATSKHGIEAYSDSLRRELMMIDIPVIKVQPGPFRTSMVASIESNFLQAEEQSTRFKKALAVTRSFAIKENNKANDPEYLASVVCKALTVRRPAAAYSVKPDLMRTILEYLPVRLADFALKKILSG